LLQASTDESLNSFAKVTLFFDTAKQIVSFFFIFLIFSAFQHIFSRFLSEEAQNWQIFIGIHIIPEEHLPASSDDYRHFRQLSAMFSSFSLKLSSKLLYLLRIQLQISLHILSGSLLIAHLQQQIASSQQVLAQRSLVLSILTAGFRPLLLLRYLLRKSCYEQNGIHIIQIHICRNSVIYI
jgi:hypothetical protein